MTSTLSSIDLTSSASLALRLEASDEGALALFLFAVDLLMPFPALEWELATFVNAVEPLRLLLFALRLLWNLRLWLRWL